MLHTSVTTPGGLRAETDKNWNIKGSVTTPVADLECWREFDTCRGNVGK